MWLNVYFFSFRTGVCEQVRPQWPTEDRVIHTWTLSRWLIVLGLSSLPHTPRRVTCQSFLGSQQWMLSRRRIPPYSLSTQIWLCEGQGIRRKLGSRNAVRGLAAGGHLPFQRRKELISTALSALGSWLPDPAVKRGRRNQARREGSQLPSWRLPSAACETVWWRP